MLHPPHSSPFPYTTLFRSSEITIRAALRGVSQDRLARPRESQARGVDPERLNPPHLLEPSPAVRAACRARGHPPGLSTGLSTGSASVKRGSSLSVPAAWRSAGGVPVVARLAEAAAVLRVVGVHAGMYQLPPFMRVVVGDCRWCGHALNADRVSCED